MYSMYMYFNCENLIYVLSLLNLYLHILWILDFKYILLLLLISHTLKNYSKYLNIQTNLSYLKINKVAFSSIICQFLVSLTITQRNNTVIILKAKIIIIVQQY